MNINSALQKSRSACRLRHLSWSTEESYCRWIGVYARWVKDHPNGDPATKLRGFLTAEAERDVAASTQNQAMSAILFLYGALGIPVGCVDALRAKRPARIRDCPTREDVFAMLDRTEDIGGYATRLIVALLYGTGMRVTEPLNLRLRDVMLAESRLLVRGAKGDKDRMVPIPCCLVAAINRQMKVARAVWAAQQDTPAALPGRIAKKYPSAPFSVQWAFLFPARRPVAHPRTGAIVRWHLHEANVQRCCRSASRKAGVAITPHALRHGYASHAMQSGALVTDIQAALGHSQLTTTSTYLHPEIARIASPLDSAPSKVVPFCTPAPLAAHA